IDSITVSPEPATVELSIGCGAANAVKTDKVKGAKKGTKVRATWEGCAGLEGKIKLRGIIVEDCGHLRGKLKAKGVKRSFDALGASGACNPGCSGLGGMRRRREMHVGRAARHARRH